MSKCTHFVAIDSDHIQRKIVDGTVQIKHNCIYISHYSIPFTNENSGGEICKKGNESTKVMHMPGNDCYR